MLHQTKLQNVRRCDRKSYFIVAQSRLFLTAFPPLLTGTTVLTVVFSLASIIAVFATFGCRTMKNHITARIVGSVEWEEPKTSNIVTTVECVSTRVCIPITIVRVASTSQTALCAKSSCSVLVALRMKCRAGTQYIGNAFVSWLHTTLDVQFVKRQPKQENG